MRLDTLVWNDWLFRVTSVHRREIAPTGLFLTSSINVNNVLIPQICQRLQYHSIEQKSLAVKVLRVPVIEVSSSHSETGDLHTASDTQILLLYSRAESTVGIST